MEPIQTVDEACWIYEQLKSVSQLTFLKLWINLFLGGPFIPINHISTTRMYMRVLSRSKSWRMSLCRSQNDGAMEVCFVHITASTINPTSCFSLREALLRQTTYHRQRKCLVKCNTHISFQHCHGPHLQLQSLHTIYLCILSVPLQIPILSHRHFSSLAVVQDVPLHMSTSTIAKHWNNKRRP